MNDPTHKRILILTHEFLPFKGGIATYCAELADAAVRRGHHVTIIAPDYHQDNSASDQQQSYTVKRFKGSLYGTRQMPSVIFEVLKINPDDYDIIHAAEWSFVVALHLVNRFKKVPFIATMHGTDINGFLTSRVTRLLRATNTLKYADLIAGNSLFTTNLASQYHPYVPKEKLKPTLLGVSQWWFEPAKNPDTILSKYNVPVNKKVILTVARLDERKGHRTTLQALSVLPEDQKNNLAYIIVGKEDNGIYKAQLEDIAKKSGVQVVFTGAIDIDDVKNLYKASWLFCMPGQSHPIKVEGFGLVYLEAAAQGLPSLATPMGGVPEVVIDGKTGVLMKDTSPHVLAAKILELLDHPEQVKQYSKNALEWAKNFTWDNCARETYE